MKVGYVTLDGAQSTAYLDEPAVAPGRYTGQDKYSDRPILVEWTDAGWRELPTTGDM